MTQVFTHVRLTAGGVRDATATVPPAVKSRTHNDTNPPPPPPLASPTQKTYCTHVKKGRGAHTIFRCFF